MPGHLAIAITVIGELCFFGLLLYAFVYKPIAWLQDTRAKQREEYKAYQQGIDNNLRTQGHSEEYVGKERQIRVLKAKRRDAKIGYYAAWIGGIICLFAFPPIGIFLTGFAIIMSIREGRKLRQEMRDAAYAIKTVRDSMPEK